MATCKLPLDTPLFAMANPNADLLNELLLQVFCRAFQR